MEETAIYTLREDPHDERSNYIYYRAKFPTGIGFGCLINDPIQAAEGIAKLLKEKKVTKVEIRSDEKGPIYTVNIDEIIEQLKGKDITIV